MTAAERTESEACRCGYDGTGPHPCHGRAYSCRKPATERFYNIKLATLAGAQLKVGADQTWACDECWARYRPSDGGAGDKKARRA